MEQPFATSTLSLAERKLLINDRQSHKLMDALFYVILTLYAFTKGW